MFCPRCGQQQANQYTRFCSKCGFSMHGMQNYIAQGGMPPQSMDFEADKSVSPKIRGLKQGGIMFLSGFIIVPLLGILTSIFNGEGYIAGAAALILFWGGILRAVYALVFQSGKPVRTEDSGFVASLRQNFLTENQQTSSRHLPHASVPAQHEVFDPKPASWRESEEFETFPRHDKATTNFDR